MTEIPRPGLRERKRVATRRAIHLAVLRLVTERGLENVTIDEISAAADVSPRTFFNYFASKEAAILGEGPELRDVASSEKFLASGAGSDVLSDLGELFAAAAEDAAVDTEALKLRQDLHKQYPQLSAMMMVGKRQFEAQVVELVVQRLVTDDPTLDAESDVTISHARLLTFVGVAAMRHAWIGWAESGSTSPLSDRIRQSFAELDSLGLSRRPDLVV